MALRRYRSAALAGAASLIAVGLTPLLVAGPAQAATDGAKAWAGPGGYGNTATPAATNAYVRAGGGNDELHGGPGKDSIMGSSGNDVLYGNDGNDDLRGGPGRDKVFGGSGVNTVIG